MSDYGGFRVITDRDCPRNMVYLINLDTVDDVTRSKLQAMIDVDDEAE